MTAAVESMMYAKDVPWHRIGTYVGDEPLPWMQALQRSGLDWQVELRKLFANDGGTFQEVPGWMRVARETDDKTLGVVTSRYAPIQNADSFRFMDTLVGAKKLRYETAGSLRGGKQIFMVAVTDKEMFVKDDQIIPYLVLSNTHDGTGRLNVILTYIRVVCMNTLTMAMQDARGRKFGIKHTGVKDFSALQEHTDQAQEVLGLAKDSMDSFERMVAKLSDISMTSAMLEKYLYALVPDPINPEASTSRAENARDSIRSALETFPGYDTTAASGTIWGMLNAATAYSTHLKTTKGGDAGRVASNLYGSSQAFANRAWNKAIEIAVA